MGGVEVDFSRWPVWLMFVLLVANLFREQIGSFIPAAMREHFQDQAKRRSDEIEHAQEIEETLLNSKLQNEAAESLRKSWREEQWLELLHQKDAWLKEVFEERLKELQASSDKTLEAVTTIGHNTKRTNDLLTTIHICLSKMADHQLKRGDDRG